MKDLSTRDTDLDLDVTVLEEWDDAPTSDIPPPRKRTTTAVQSPIQLAILCEVCKVL